MNCSVARGVGGGFLVGGGSTSTMVSIWRHPPTQCRRRQGINALVAASAPAGEQGAAQGGVNGLKALTEGVGPLLFATVFVFFDADSALPGAPYLLGAVLVQYALKLSSEIPSAVPNSPLRPKSTGHLRQEGVL